MRKTWLAAPRWSAPRCCWRVRDGCDGSGSRRRAGARSASARARRNRLAQPVRRVQPGRVQRLRVHLPGPRPVRQQTPFRPVLRAVVEHAPRAARPGRSGRSRTPSGRRQAAHGGRRGLDDQHRHQVQGRRRRRTRPGSSPTSRTQPHRTRRRSSSTTRGAELGIRARPVPAVLDPAEAHLGAAPRPQGRRPEDVPEQRTGRRRRPVQPHQVPEGTTSRSSSATTILLGRSRRSTSSGCSSSRTTTRWSPRSRRTTSTRSRTCPRPR